MTLNEWRDKLAAEFPGWTVYFKAESWHHDGTSRDETNFHAGVFVGGIGVTSGDWPTPELAMADLRTQMAPPEDNPIEAEPEPQEAVR